MSVFAKLRPETIETFQGKDFSLKEPSAHNRDRYFVLIGEMSDEEEDEGITADTTAITKDDKGSVKVNFKSVARNNDVALFAIALCLFEGLKLSLDDCWKDLKDNASTEAKDFFYDKCMDIIFPKAPEDIPDPKADQVSDSPTA